MHEQWGVIVDGCPYFQTGATDQSKAHAQMWATKLLETGLATTAIPFDYTEFTNRLYHSQESTSSILADLATR